MPIRATGSALGRVEPRSESADEGRELAERVHEEGRVPETYRHHLQERVFRGQPHFGPQAEISPLAFAARPPQAIPTDLVSITYRRRKHVHINLRTPAILRTKVDRALSMGSVLESKNRA